MKRYCAWCPPLDGATQHRTTLGAHVGARRLRRKARRELVPATADAHDQYVEIIDWRDVDVAIPCTDSQGVFVARLGVFGNSDRVRAVGDAARRSREKRIKPVDHAPPKPLISPDPAIRERVDSERRLRGYAEGRDVPWVPNTPLARYEDERLRLLRGAA